MTGTPASAARKLSVSKTKGLSRTGQTVVVSGSGYDVTKGIYVAFCQDNGAGVLPSPCGGGADMTGASGGSAWISSNPPSYGEGLATPYGKGGSFRVSIRVTQMIGDVDCTIRACAIVTRNDHTRTSDRSQDVRVPVRFAAAATGSGSGSSSGSSGSGSGSSGSGSGSTGAGSGSAGAGVAATAAPASAAKNGRPVGPPTGKLATAAPPGATTAAAVALQAMEPPLTRTSSATPLGHWWAIGGAFLTGLLLAALTGRIRRTRTATKTPRGSM